MNSAHALVLRHVSYVSASYNVFEEKGLTRLVARVMRCLCSIHLFRETADDVFSNNIITKSLVNNDPLRAYVLLW